MSVNHAAMKLGKQPARIDQRTLKMARYMTPDLQPPPVAVNHSRGLASWGMMCNDRLGCCTISAVGHADQVMVLSQILPGKSVGLIHPSDDIILRYYEEWDGYDPFDPSTDQGGDELTVLNLWRKQGFSGRNLLAYADPDPKNQEHVKQAIYLFGGLYIGVQMPMGWQGANLWDANMGEPGSWGGHAVFVCDYDRTGLTLITWGELQRMSWAGFAEYVDECHALITPEWRPPAGFDLHQLQSDLAAIIG